MYPSRLILLLLTTLLSHSLARAEALQVVASIKPLHSLVSRLSAGVNEPVLLLPGSFSPHHASLRPSQRRLLAEADLVVRIGPQLEGFLDKAMRGQPQRLLNVIDAPGLKLLPLRGRHGQTEDGHSHHHGHDTDSPDAGIDPHIWLSPANAAAISRYITDALIRLDAAHAPQYQQNLQALLVDIETLDQRLRKQLSPVTRSADRSPAFLSFHDAFAYFEQTYALPYAGSVNLDAESPASLKQLGRIHRLISERQIHCLVYQPPKAALVDRLQQSTGIHPQALDPLGAAPPGPKAWFSIMQQLGQGFTQCLKNGE